MFIPALPIQVVSAPFLSLSGILSARFHWGSTAAQGQTAEDKLVAEDKKGHVKML